jgi:hypothetical protein
MGPCGHSGHAGHDLHRVRTVIRAPGHQAAIRTDGKQVRGTGRDRRYAGHYTAPPDSLVAKSVPPDRAVDITAGSKYVTAFGPQDRVAGMGGNLGNPGERLHKPVRRCEAAIAVLAAMGAAFDEQGA